VKTDCAPERNFVAVKATLHIRHLASARRQARSREEFTMGNFDNLRLYKPGNWITTGARIVDRPQSEPVVEVEVQAKDYAGNDKAKARFFDDKNEIDIPLEHTKMVPSQEGDELWKAEIPLSRLTEAGIDVRRFYVTTRIEVPDRNEVNWEMHDQPVRGLRRNVIEQSFVTGPEEFEKSKTTATGEIKLTTGFKFFQSNKSSSEDQALRKITFKPTTEQFKNSDTLDVVVIPRYSMKDRRENPNDFGQAHYVTKTLLDIPETNIISLKRQPDGSFLAEAGAGKAFINVTCNNVYMGDDTQYGGYQVAIVDPATGTWDSNGGKNYDL
jgi:hypothetical protein